MEEIEIILRTCQALWIPFRIENNEMRWKLSSFSSWNRDGCVSSFLVSEREKERFLFNIFPSMLVHLWYKWFFVDIFLKPTREQNYSLDAYSSDTVSKTLMYAKTILPACLVCALYIKNNKPFDFHQNILLNVALKICIFLTSWNLLLRHDGSSKSLISFFLFL